VDADDDAVVAECDLGVLCVDLAGGLVIAAQVVASVGCVEELVLQGALKGLGGYADLGGAGCGSKGS